MKKKSMSWVQAIAHYVNIPTLSVSIIISLQSLTSFASLTPTNDGEPALRKKPRIEVTQDSSNKEKSQNDSNSGDLYGQFFQDVVIKDDWTQLHWAAYYGYKRIVEGLTKTSAEKDAQDKNGETPLHKAVNKGHLEVVEILLRAGANKNAVDIHGSTSLHKAARKGYEVIVDVLIKADADKNVIDKWKATPVYYAVVENHKKVVEILLKAGVQTNSVDTIYNRVPLHTAACNGSKAIVELFLKYGIRPDVVDEYGKTPLYSAVEEGHQEVVEILLRADAKADTVDRYDRTPLAHALQTHARGKGRHGIINALLLVDMNTLSLGDTFTFSLKTRHLLEKFKFETSLFESIVKQSKKLSEELFQECSIPKVLVRLIIEYHDCADTRISLFKKAESLLVTP